MRNPVGIATNETVVKLPSGLRFGDPTTRFSEAIQHAALTIEGRSDDELKNDGLNHPDPVLREFALYQLLARRREAALPTLEQALREDTDTDLRVNVLWALEWLESERCRQIGLDLMNDKDHRVQEWARVFAWEMGWTDQDFRRAREYKYYEGRTFDQTIYLHITCNLYIRLGEGTDMWGHILMSPQMLARVYGQAKACPIVETRDREIVISKTLKGLHDDGSEHYEAFLFRGFTEQSTPTQGNFYFETHTERPFFLSGKANDTSKGVVERVNVPFAREGQWFLNPNIEIKGKNAIEYVRGLFQGWAFVNLERIAASGGEFLFPGNSVLSTLHHPEVGAKTNTFLNGRFKGKVVDWNGDGIIDLNYLPGNATAKGEIDSNNDGIADAPGQTVSWTPTI
jgi:HEAT repeat protein